MAYSLSGLVYTGNSFTCTGRYVEDVFFNPDGSEFFICDSQVGASSAIVQYTMSTSWDITSASVGSSLTVGGTETRPTGLFFKSGGTMLYVVGTGNDIFLEYSLSTAWDLTTASLNTTSAAGTTSPTGCHVSSDGTKLINIDWFADVVRRFPLSTAWDLSTKGSEDNTIDLTSDDGGMEGLRFSPDGSKMYAVGQNNNAVYEYDLSTAWQPSTASKQNTLTVTSQDGTPSGCDWNDAGTILFVAGRDSDTIYEYAGLFGHGHGLLLSESRNRLII